MLENVPIPDSVLRRSYAFDRFGCLAAVLDAEGVVVETNEAWRLHAALNEAAPGTTGAGVNYLHVCDRAYAAGLRSAGEIAAGLRDVLNGERISFEAEYAGPSPLEDRWFLLHASTAPVHDGAGAVLFHVDVTARRRLEERLDQGGARGVATGLLDHFGSIEHIEDGLAIAEILGERLTIIDVRVEGLAAIERRLGRPVVEDLIGQVTERARRALRADDRFCRLGVHELVVVCADLGEDDAAAIATRLRDVLAIPFQIGVTELSVDVVVGVAGATRGGTVEELLSTAAAAGRRSRRRSDRRSTTRADVAVEIDADSEKIDEAAVALAVVRSGAQRDAVVAQSTELVMYFDADGAIVWASPGTRLLFGIDPETIVGRNSFDFIHPDDRARVLRELLGVGGLGDHVLSQFRIISDDGEIHWIEETITNMIDDPQVGYIVSNLHDITARKQDEDEIRLRNRLLDAAGQAIIAVDMHGSVIYWNPAATHTYGWAVDEAVGRSLGELLLPATGWEAGARVVENHVLAGQAWSGDFLTRRKDGSTVPVFLTDTPVFDDAGTQIGIIAVSSDITERKRLESEVWRLATQDPLTGLANRTQLLEQLDEILDSCRSEAADVGVFLFDVDRFKLINDSLGHDRGDQLLAAIADVLRETLGPGEIAARFGSDAFAIVAPDLASTEHALALVKRIQARLAGGLSAGVERYVATISVGIVIAKPGDTAITALRQAETAMYRAKENGRDRAEWFDPSLQRDVVASFVVERELRHAITSDELFLEFQPVFDLQTGDIASCEALVRWMHPERGRLYPEDFIPVAEATGLIVGLGRWLLPRALEIAATWPPAVRLAVNLSSRELAEPDIVAFTEKMLTNVGFAASRLVLEITETAVITDPTAAARTISALRTLGVSVVIDDFGTGYTSLAFLRDYQLDGLKIDRSFVTQLGHGSTAIVDAMIRMSAALGLSVIAEGIETEDELAQLRALGCRFIQGYLLSRPVAPDQILFGARGPCPPARSGQP